MPDNRHIVISLAAGQNPGHHLSIADIESNELTPLTIGNQDELYPSVSPDGRSLIYEQDLSGWDVVSVSVDDGSTKTVIGIGRKDVMAAWSARQAKLAWVTDRNGPEEIWLRGPDGSERPAITAQNFPLGTSKALMNPSLSPDGDRLVFGRVDLGGVARLWISSLSGGVPVLLTNSERTLELGGSWSPDGSRFVYVAYEGGETSIMTVKTSGGATPIKLADTGKQNDLPDWSSTGDWITYHDDKGWNLISPDGKRTKFLGKIQADYLAFSKDGKMLYGIETGETEADQDRATLFSLETATLKQKVIKNLGGDFAPSTKFRPGIRFSLSPDGKIRLQHRQVQKRPLDAARLPPARLVEPDQDSAARPFLSIDKRTGPIFRRN